MRAIVDHVAHPIFVKDREFRFVVLNRAFTEFVGFSREEMIGKTDYDFFPDEQSDFFRKKDIEMFASGATVQIEEEPITAADGELHILATTKVPYRNGDGVVTHVIGIIKDITELKRAEDALRHANEDLERAVAERTAELAVAQDELLRKERLAVLGQLSGGLAHQLRNPLAAIQNAVAVLRRSIPTTGGNTDHSGKALAIIDEEVRRADRTIRDLLDYAAIRPPRTLPVVVAELIDQVIDLEAQHTPVVLEVHADPAAVALVDESQMVAALGNVVRNALEAVQQKVDGRVRIDATCRDDHVLIEVQDNGSGVLPAAKDSLFEPLVTTKPLGVGLGLSIARSLVFNQGGDIRLMASDLGGAGFAIELPRGTAVPQDA